CDQAQWSHMQRSISHCNRPIRRSVMQHRNEECRRSSPQALRILTGLFLVLALTAVGLAQVDRSSLNGTVTDPNGGVLPGVKVVGVQNATGLQRTAVTSEDGTYEIPELPVGLYTVTFSHDGFRPLTLANVVQELSKTRTVNVSLKVGGPNEKVEVPFNQPLLDQTTNSLGSVIEDKQAQQLP